ncbi:hypothetical protein [Saccharolobus solfataricus]|nr:hypothetical protein [Saccharolobus solfataricus]
MSNEEIIDTIIKSPQLISALAEKVYEKLKDEIVIKSLKRTLKQ